MQYLQAYTTNNRTKMSKKKLALKAQITKNTAMSRNKK